MHMITRGTLPLWILLVGGIALIVHPALADPIGLSTLIAFILAVLWACRATGS
jgi:hypothetical protein